MTISIETQGRRHYLRGDTYPIKDALRAAGAHWDAEAKAWWTGQLELAQQMVEKAATTPEKSGAKYTRIGDAWGVTVYGPAALTVTSGSVVVVTKRDGSTKSEKIDAVQRRDDDGAVCTIVPSAAPRRSGGRTWDSNAYNGRGQRRGGYRRACKTGGNCSSFGSGKSCGGHDCDGF